MSWIRLRRAQPFLSVLAALFIVAGCATPPVAGPAQATPPAELQAADLDNDKLRVVATTNIVADVVAQIGGEHIELTALMELGVDPHGYQLTPGDRRMLEDAQVVFINGLGLEEGVLPFLSDLDSGAPVVAVNAGVETREFGELGHDHDADEHADEHADDQDHAHDGDDPHTWLSVPLVMAWTGTIADALSALDPANADAYAAAAAAYREDLAALDAEIRELAASLPAERRKLVTDHDSFGYYAAEYGFTVIGSVIPSFSTMSAPSAQDLAQLQDQIAAERVPAIFVSTTVNPGVADRIAQDLGIRVVVIYHGALSDAAGSAPTYVDMMRYNTQAIVTALQ